MDVEIITDKVPARGLLIRSHHRLDMRKAIFLGPRRSATGSDELSADHIPTQDKGAGAMTNVFKCAALHFSRGKPGCLRSRACTPVSSSVLMVRSPCLATSGAC